MNSSGSCRSGWGGVKAEAKAPARQLNLTLTQQEKQWLDEHPKIRLGIDPAWPPIEMMDAKGQHQGITADYMKIIGESLGLDISVSPGLNWSQVLEGAKRHEIDLLPALVETEARREYLNFTESYLDFPFVIFVRERAPFIGGAGRLGGKTSGSGTGLCNPGVSRAGLYPATTGIRGKYPGGFGKPLSGAGRCLCR
ncbi:MAG: hypothetical protein DIZ77_13685 [endosymbiont of Seepiophila jonesi]|uniref:Solute-binding protein family 3/N-terminal domain-containing protein n=1 Tax=endosymbiont of Lamellibrachia luymesi TaxID=2200907 RepID=A0A370DYZ5_9GAMM|nr:MAG: hypothetical protein DIZ77_13685 [endosymbiont of Seepiophila jonesi]RDH91655.1 MAG: hypothetical protein DIZ79_05580 [endosymbiont of Lamellibrachia luymesi]